MAGLLPGDLTHHGMVESGSYSFSQDRPEEVSHWYLSRKEIEENSPSRRDCIDLKKETYLRKSYCTFLQDLGMRLKVPQVTIATAIIFCHRFFLCQSHAKNDRRTIATVCMFLAGKVEETPRPLKDVILVSYEIIHKKDPAAVQRIKQKEVYEQQKELILIAERVVLATLGFDFNVHHPYKPLVEAIKKFKVAQNALAQVAWNFVNDGLRTSLCLQFKPHHIAAGAIFLAAKFLKVKLPSDGEKVWWQEFDVTPRQLEEVSNQMLELYEQNRVPPSQESEVEGSAGAGARGPAKNPSEHKVDGEIKDHQHPEQEPLPYNRGNMGEASNKPRFVMEQLVEDDEERNNGRSETTEAGEWKNEGATYKSGNTGGRNLEYREGTLGQSPQDAIKKIDKDKLKAALEKRKKSRGDMARRMDLMDEDDLIERELEDGIELPAEDEKIKREKRQSWSKPPSNMREPGSPSSGHGNYRGTEGQSSRGPDAENVEEGEVSLFDDADQGLESPKSISRKRKAGSPNKYQLEGKQWHDSRPGYHHDFSEDGNRMGRLGYTERDHKRHVQENHV